MMAADDGHREAAAWVSRCHGRCAVLFAATRATPPTAKGAVDLKVNAGESPYLPSGK